MNGRGQELYTDRLTDDKNIENNVTECMDTLLDKAYTDYFLQNRMDPEEANGPFRLPKFFYRLQDPKQYTLKNPWGEILCNSRGQDMETLTKNLDKYCRSIHGVLYNSNEFPQFMDSQTKGFRIRFTVQREDNTKWDISLVLHCKQHTLDDGKSYISITTYYDGAYQLDGYYSKVFSMGKSNNGKGVVSLNTSPFFHF